MRHVSDYVILLPIHSYCISMQTGRKCQGAVKVREIFLIWAVKSLYFINILSVTWLTHPRYPATNTLCSWLSLTVESATRARQSRPSSRRRNSPWASSSSASARTASAVCCICNGEDKLSCYYMLVFILPSYAMRFLGDDPVSFPINNPAVKDKIEQTFKLTSY